MERKGEVERGVALALEAHRQELLDDQTLQLVFAYYDNEGSQAPLPAEQVLAHLGGLDPSTITRLTSHGAATAVVQGQRLNERLTLLDVLGQGGMGAVHRAYDGVLRRIVAVKLIRSDRLSSENAKRHLTRFEQEARAMAKVHHPACVQIHDVGLNSGQPYLVMEYVAGTSLAEVIQQAQESGHPLEARKVAAWGKTIAEGLQACHEAGIVHRDVKPANILIDSQGQPRLTDFGIARDEAIETRVTADQAAVGTLAYLPPEQAGGGEPDPRSDVYALGATMYETLSGRTVFDAPLALSLLKMIVNDRPSPVRTQRPDLPLDLEMVVLKCLEKEQADRYGSAQALALDLGRFLAGEPVVARHLTPTTRALRVMWKRRRTLSALAVTIATAIGGVLLWRVMAHAQRRAEHIKILERIELDLATVRSSSRTLNTAGSELQRLTVEVDQDLGARARAALKRLEGVKWLVQADAALGRYLVLRTETDFLETREFALESTRVIRTFRQKQPELMSVRRRLRELRDLEMTAFADCDRLLARAGVYLSSGLVEHRMAQLYVVRGRQLERERGPAFAEQFLSHAADLARSSNPLLTRELRLPNLKLSPPEPADFRLLEYSFDPKLGCQTPVLVREGRTPARILSLPPGRYQLRLSAPGRMSIQCPVVLRRGADKTLAHSLPDPRPLGPLAGQVVRVVGGLSQRGRRLRRTTEVSDFFLKVHEVTMEEWRSFVISAQKPRTFLPIATGTSAMEQLMNRRFARYPASGVSYNEVREYIKWFQSELTLVNPRIQVRLPTAPEFHWAIRGELGWTFPWGDQEVYGLFLNAASINDPACRAVGSFPMDKSPFGVFDLVSSVSEFTKSDIRTEKSAAKCFGGDWSCGFERMSLRARRETFVYPEVEDVVIGFRYALTLNSRKGVTQANVQQMRESIRHADAHLARGHLASALRAATNAISSNRRQPAGWNKRAVIRARLGDTWGAKWDLDQSLLLDPEQHNALVNRGAVQKLRGLPEKALTDFDRAVELSPDLPRGLIERGVLHAEQGRPRKAIPDLRRFLRVAPGHRRVGQVRQLIEKLVSEADR